jgi:hypothetical protein
VFVRNSKKFGCTLEQKEVNWVLFRGNSKDFRCAAEPIWVASVGNS